MPTKTRAKPTTRAKKAPARKAAAKPRSRATAAAKVAKRAAASASTPAQGPRRAVFIDVENTSSESELVRVLNDLAIDLSTGTTDVTAIGNWRVVGQQLGRSLAQRGAHLVHSAPATRVPDWSDLWIAVQAGIWLGRSRPGDAIDIVSHDRAFDAVGDAAARLGVRFNRITYRSAGAHAGTGERASEPVGERRGRRRRRRGGSGRAGETAHVASPSRSHHAAQAHGGDDEPHAASQEQLQNVIARLTAADPSHTVTLDALTVALKAAGFQRPPGSPRLVTRLRRMKGVEVLPNGKVRMTAVVESAVTDAPAEPIADEAAVQNGTGEHASEGATAKRRSRRRGGRRRGGRGRKSTTAASPPQGE